MNKMSEIVTRWLLLALTLLPVWSASNSVLAMEKNDTLEIHYRTGQGEVDLFYEDNQRNLDTFIKRIKALDAAFIQDASICIYGGSSPEICRTGGKIKALLFYEKENAIIFLPLFSAS